MNGGMYQNLTVRQARPNEPELDQPLLASNNTVPRLNFRWLLTGPSKSGKTNLARWAVDHIYVKPNGQSFFDEIYLLSPTANIDYNWSDLVALKPKNRITNPSPEFLKKLLNDQKRDIQGSINDVAAGYMGSRQLAKRKLKAKKLLVIFDDAIAESRLINSPDFLKIFVAGRHYNINSMVMTQSYVKVPRSVRLQATHVSMFPSRSTEIDRLFTEHGPKELTKNQFKDMVTYATQPREGDEYPFLYVDAFAPSTERFRRNFTEVLEIGGGGDTLPPDAKDDGDDKTRTIEEEPPMDRDNQENQTPRRPVTIKRPKPGESIRKRKRKSGNVTGKRPKRINP